MTRPTVRGFTAALLTACAAVIPGSAAQAQLGGLIKKKVTQATAPKSTGEAVAFNDVILELTPERIGKVAAGKQAGNRLANGPVAARKKLEALEDRQSKLYERHVDAINGYDEKRRDQERCRDSILVEVKDGLNMSASAEIRQKMTQLAFRMAQAQQRGDSAEIRQIAEELRRLHEPSAADTARAVRACPLGPKPPPVQEWEGVTAEVEKTKKELEAAEQAIADAEEAASGMNRRQLAMACERILLYLQRAQANQKQSGFTTTELEALEQAIREVQGLCK